MRRWFLVLILSGFVGGCSASGDVPDSADGDSARSIVSLELLEVRLEEGAVLMRNYTSVAVSLSGRVLCTSGDCVELPPLTVPGGTSVWIGASDLGGLRAAVELPALDPLHGEIALFRPGGRNSSTIEEYFEWGSTPHTWTPTAVSSGLWVEGSYGPTSARATRLFRNLDTGLWLWE